MCSSVLKKGKCLRVVRDVGHVCAQAKSGNVAKVRNKRQIFGSSVHVRTGKYVSRLGTIVKVIHSFLPRKRR